MALSTEKKGDVLARFRRSAKDTGSAEGQVALLSERINGLGEHLNAHKADHSLGRGRAGARLRRGTAASGPGFFPPDGQLPGKDLRRGTDPGWFFPPRGPPDGTRDTHLAPDRPPDTSAVSRQLSQRRAGGGDGAVAGP